MCLLTVDASQMISCGINQSSNPTGCVVESFNLIYYLENNENNTEEIIEYFNWVPYDLYTHMDSSCNFTITNTSLLELIIGLSQTLQLQPQFNLYNIPMIYYVK